MTNHQNIAKLSALIMKLIFEFKKNELSDYEKELISNIEKLLGVDELDD